MIFCLISLIVSETSGETDGFSLNSARQFIVVVKLLIYKIGAKLQTFTYPMCLLIDLLAHFQR